MKKVVSLMLVFILVLGGFVFARAEEKVILNLTRAVFNLPASDPAQVKKVEDAINAYIADRIDVEIRLTELGSDDYYNVVY